MGAGEGALRAQRNGALVKHPQKEPPRLGPRRAGPLLLPLGALEWGMLAVPLRQDGLPYQDGPTSGGPEAGSPSAWGQAPLKPWTRT